MIRKMIPSDKAAFLEMTREFYRSPAVSHDIPEAFHEDAFREMMSGRDLMWGYLLEDDREGAAAGYAIVSRTYSHEAGGIVWWLEEIYVRPAFQGRGLGKACLKAVLEQAKEQKAARLRLEAEPDNLRAKALYRRFGFQDLEYDQLVLED